MAKTHEPRPRPVVELEPMLIHRMNEDFHEESTSKNIETGWLLLGQQTETTIRVIGLIDDGPKVDASAHHVAFDLDYQALAFELLRGQHADLEVVGVAHSHPRGLTNPSKADFQGDLKWIEALEQRRAFFMICTPLFRRHRPVEIKGRSHELHFNGMRASCFELDTTVGAYRRVVPQPSSAGRPAVLPRPLAQTLATYCDQIDEARQTYPDLVLNATDTTLVLSLARGEARLCAILQDDHPPRFVLLLLDAGRQHRLPGRNATLVEAFGALLELLLLTPSEKQRWNPSTVR